MKLKNKQTGEIGTLTLSSNGEELLLMKNNEMVTRNVKLSDLEEWEDAPEEPKMYWYVQSDGFVLGAHKGQVGSLDEGREKIGNYFSSKEEAELAVRKLKAWKRLKDKGFRFIDHIDRDSGQGMARYEWDGYVNGEDLDLLLCSEENI